VLEARSSLRPAGRHYVNDARTDAFVTNAVKHFRHEMRGKRRQPGNVITGSLDAGPARVLVAAEAGLPEVAPC